MQFLSTSPASPTSPAPASPAPLGPRIRALRKARDWSLEQASAHTGLSRSALSKIERGQMSPTFTALQKLAQGFGLGLADLLEEERRAAPPSGRRSITRAGEGTFRQLPNYGLRLLSADLKHTAFMPYETVARRRSLEAFGDWDRHDSEDFVYVLEGQAMLYTELYEPVLLDTGDCVHFDANMGHVFLSAGEVDARMLCISAMGAAARRDGPA